MALWSSFSRGPKYRQRHDVGRGPKSRIAGDSIEIGERHDAVRKKSRKPSRGVDVMGSASARLPWRLRWTVIRLGLRIVWRGLLGHGAIGCAGLAVGAPSGEVSRLSPLSESQGPQVPRETESPQPAVPLGRMGGTLTMGRPVILGPDDMPNYPDTDDVDMRRDSK